MELSRGRDKREPTLVMVAFIAFYRSPWEPMNYSNHPYKCGCFQLHIGLLSLKILYVVSEVIKSWPMEVP
jgi:hypothetical protein